MRNVDDYERIRKAYQIEGLNIREISHRVGYGGKLFLKELAPLYTFENEGKG